MSTPFDVFTASRSGGDGGMGCRGVGYDDEEVKGEKGLVENE